MDLYSTKSASYKLGFNYITVLNRAQVLSLKPIKRDKTFYWSEDQIIKIKTYSEQLKRRRAAISRFQSDNIKIVELFLSLKNNSAAEIQKTVPLTTSYINKIIDLYLETKCVFVESKMNKIT